MDYVGIYKFQEGGMMEAPEQQMASEQEPQDQAGQLMMVMEQILTDQDCEGAMQLIQMLMEQMQGTQTPAFKRGGMMKKKKAKYGKKMMYGGKADSKMSMAELNAMKKMSGGKMKK